MRGESEPLTKEEKSWIRRMNTLLKACPSDRFGFFTIGDNDVMIYDASRKDEIDALFDTSNGPDFCVVIDRLDAGLGEVTFPAQVHSTAG